MRWRAEKPTEIIENERVRQFNAPASDFRPRASPPPTVAMKSSPAPSSPAAPHADAPRGSTIWLLCCSRSSRSRDRCAYAGEPHARARGWRRRRSGPRPGAAAGHAPEREAALEPGAEPARAKCRSGRTSGGSAARRSRASTGPASGRVQPQRGRRGRDYQDIQAGRCVAANTRPAEIALSVPRPTGDRALAGALPLIEASDDARLPAPAAGRSPRAAAAGSPRSTSTSQPSPAPPRRARAGRDRSASYRSQEYHLQLRCPARVPDTPSSLEDRDQPLPEPPRGAQPSPVVRKLTDDRRGLREAQCP